MSEHFLGSRGLGMWAFALTFVATNAREAFMGFPALIYTHGWILRFGRPATWWCPWSPPACWQSV